MPFAPISIDQRIRVCHGVLMPTASMVPIKREGTNPDGSAHAFSVVGMPDMGTADRKYHPAAPKPNAAGKTMTTAEGEAGVKWLWEWYHRERPFITAAARNNKSISWTGKGRTAGVQVYLQNQKRVRCISIWSNGRLSEQPTVFEILMGFRPTYLIALSCARWVGWKAPNKRKAYH